MLTGAERGGHIAPYPGMVPVDCDGCGAMCWKWPNRVARASRLYCSTTCQRSNRSGEANPKWRGGQHDLTCAVCAKCFRVDVGQAEKGRRFCSIACKAEGTRIHATALDRRRAMSRRYECRERAEGRQLNHHTEAEWRALLASHEGRCVRCGTDKRIERDHILPLSKGGDDVIANIQPLCCSCNRRKGSRLECAA